jgi:hypothetical protein
MNLPDHLDWHDRKACAQWLATLKVAVESAVAVGADQIQPMARRDLGRHAARTALVEAWQSIESLFAFAQAGLDANDPLEPSDPTGSGGAGPTY